MSRVAATIDFAGLKIRMMPDQSGLRSVDLQTGHTLPIVTALHFLQATSLANYLLPPAPPFFSFIGAAAGGCFALRTSCSIHSVAPRKGCLHVIPIFPMAAPFPRLMAVTLARIRERPAYEQLRQRARAFHFDRLRRCARRPLELSQIVKGDTHDPILAKRDARPLSYRTVLDPAVAQHQ